MDPKIVEYLKRIIKTISMALLWMSINVWFGIKDNYAFIDRKISTANLLFYIWFLLSLISLFYYIYKIWKTDLHFEDDAD